MKQTIVNIIFNLGHLASKIMYKIPVFYNIYSYLMSLSCRLQDKWHLKEPWNKPNKK